MAGGLFLLPALFCAASAAEIVPAPRDSGCQIMPEKCPAGWSEKTPAQSSGDGWVECCPQAGPFPELPPQKPERIPACPGSSKDPNEWVAFGIEGEGGCDLSDPSCPVRAPDYDARPQAPPADGPRKIFPLADLPGPAAAGPLKGLAGRSPDERCGSALALARDGNAAASAFGVLARALKRDPSPKVRACAALALTIVSPGRAVAPLRAALADQHAGVRHAAAKALSRIGTPEARKTLRVAKPE